MKIENNSQIKNEKFANYESVQYMFDNYWFVIQKGAKDGYIANSFGKALTEAKYWKYEGITGGDYEFILMSSNNHGKSTLLNKQDFSVIIPPDYDVICCFWEGLADVKLNNKYGFIDIEGNVVIPIIYDYVDNFKNGIAKVELNGESFYINKKGVKIKNNSDKI